MRAPVPPNRTDALRRPSSTPGRRAARAVALCAALGAGVAGTALPARAQDAPATDGIDPAASAAASRLLDTMRIGELMAQLMNEMPGVIGGAIPIAPDQDPAMRDELMRLAMVKMEEYVGFDALRDEYVALYANSYSAEDMDALSDFFDTDVGQRYLDAQPAMTTESGRIVQERMQVAFPEVMAYVQAEAERLQSEAE